MLKRNISKMVMIVGVMFSCSLFAQPTDSISGKDSIPTQDTTKSNSEKLYSMTIKTIPDSAVVVFDDEVKGLTPLKVSDLKAGEHTIIFKKKGFYQKRISTIVDSASAEKDLVVTLQQPGSIMISSEPSGAEIFLNNTKKGISPLKIDLLKPGEYTLLLKKSQYNDFEKSIKIESGKSDSLFCTLSLDSAYIDSVNQAVKQTTSKRKKITSVIIASAFCLFAAIIAIIDFTGEK